MVSLRKSIFFGLSTFVEVDEVRKHAFLVFVKSIKGKLIRKIVSIDGAI